MLFYRIRLSAHFTALTCMLMLLCLLVLFRPRWLVWWWNVVVNIDGVKWVHHFNIISRRDDYSSYINFGRTMKKSWIKLFTVALRRASYRNGDQGWNNIPKKRWELAWLDLSTHMIGEFGCKASSFCCDLVIYKESILPIGGINN